MLCSVMIVKNIKILLYKAKAIWKTCRSTLFLRNVSSLYSDELSFCLTENKFFYEFVVSK